VGNVCVGVIVAVVVGGLATRSARGESGVANIALPPVTVTCPTLGHSSGPDANGWTTQFVRPNDQAKIIAEVNPAAETLKCSYMMRAGDATTIANVSKVAPSGAGVWLGSGLSQPALFKRGQDTVACPSLSLTDSLDDPAWTTKHGGTGISADVVGAQLTCREVASGGSAAAGAVNVVQLATATRPFGKLQNCQVASNGSSFNCLGAF
jgi:hypothetical protein